MSESRRRHNRTEPHTASNFSAYPRDMETIELNSMAGDPESRTNISAQPGNVHLPASSMKQSSEPRSPYQQSTESGWSNIRLLQWLKTQRRDDNSVTDTQRFTLTRELGADDYHLAITGYDPVFRRYFTRLDNLFAMLATMGLATSLPAIMFLVSTYAGGPIAALINWIMIGGFSIVLALCLGEIAASMPTSAGLYFYSYRLGGNHHGPFLAWLTAWLSWTGWLTVVPASAQLSANFLLSIFAIHFEDAAFVQHTGFHWFLILMTLSTLVLLPNISSHHAILWALRICIGTSTLLILMYMAWFPAKVETVLHADNLQRFDNLINHENVIYAPDTYAWAMGALFPAWIFKGFEVSIHLLEETKRASRSVAMAIWTGILTGYVIGIPVIVVLLSCVQDFAVISHAAHDLPQGFAVFLLDLVGHKGALAILALAWVDSALVTAVLFMTAQRLTFALARDQVLPLSPWISTVSKRQLPVNAAYIVFVYALLMSMVGVIGRSTFQALLAIAVVAQDLSYAIVIFARLTYGRARFQPASWNLGKWSIPLNITALIYSGYLFFILILPFWFPVCAEDFNFAPIALSVIMLLALATWLAPRIEQHKKWKGPRVVIRNDIVLANTPPDRSPQFGPRLGQDWPRWP